jgi:hypothetical protein
MLRAPADPQRRAALQTAIAKFDALGTSVIEAHPEHCCVVGRAWFCALARAHAATQGELSPWMRKRWQWGPCERPVYWCQLAEREVLDCSMLARLSREALAAVGRSSRAVQVIESYDETVIANWKFSWRAHGGGYWLSDGLVYHEIVAVEDRAPGAVRLWDPTDEAFTDGRARVGWGAVLGLRLLSEGAWEHAHDGYVTWCGQRIRLDHWELGPEPTLDEAS